MNWGKTWKWIGRTFVFALLIHIIILVLFYFFQEKVLFNPSSFPENYDFQFRQHHDEVFLPTADKKIIHGALFSRPANRRVVLFLHGNGGTISQWGHQAQDYLDHGHDVFFIDYRGYGKSTGHIQSEKMLVDDAELAYNYLLTKYDESIITLAGMSMGTGIATQLASRVDPAKLILMAPYSSLENLIVEKGKVVPRKIIRYKFQTDKTIPSLNCPIVIMHGIEDRLIPYEHGEILQKLREGIRLIPIKSCGHMVGHCGQYYRMALREALVEND